MKKIILAIILTFVSNTAIAKWVEYWGSDEEGIPPNSPSDNLFDILCF